MPENVGATIDAGLAAIGPSKKGRVAAVRRWLAANRDLYKRPAASPTPTPTPSPTATPTSCPTPTPCPACPVYLSATMPDVVRNTVETALSALGSKWSARVARARQWLAENRDLYKPVNGSP